MCVCPTICLFLHFRTGLSLSLLFGFQFAFRWRFVLGKGGLTVLFKPALTNKCIFIPNGALCIPTVFCYCAHRSRPSPAALECFAPRCPLSFNCPLFVPRTSSRPSPTALFCFPPRFLFVSHSSPGPSPTGSLCIAQRIPLYPRPHSFVSRDIFLYVYLLPRAHFLLFCRSYSFVLIPRCPLLSTFSKQYDANGPMSAFCLANIFHCIPMRSSGFAYALPLLFPLKMAFWSRFMAKCRSCWAATSGFFRNTVLGGDSSCEQGRQRQWGCRKTTKTQETSCKHIGMAKGNCRECGKKLEVEVRELALSSFLYTVGFRQYLLSVNPTLNVVF